MNLIKGTTRLLVRTMTARPIAGFAGDSWKDRDEAAEKVYINRK